jgi:predicted AAA+ superfamily ATPase
MLARNIETNLLEACSDTPVVLLNGARQTGKTTLVRSLAQERLGASYVSLDDLTELTAAKNDPVIFINQLKRPVIIDEVQRAPEIFLPIKVAVDSARVPGSFILTGSANVFTLPKLADSLAGRIEILTLWPLSQGEIEGRKEDFISDLFAEEMTRLTPSPLDRTDLLERILQGGFPAVRDRGTSEGRRRWYESYRTTLLERDARDISMIRSVNEFPKLLSVLASRTSSLLNLADISRNSGIQQDTLRRYYSLLQALFLIVELPAWFANLGKRLVKTPKIALADTGLWADILGVEIGRLRSDAVLLGQSLENFVVMELRKQSTWSRQSVRLHHFRDQKDHEVDIVLEDRSGDLVGIEVKGGATATVSDFNGLRKLKDLTGARFKRGVVLHTGQNAVPFSDGLWALPIQCLWRGPQS